MWKFRSMVVNADKTGPGITARQDSRVTRFGAFLRKSKLDELPQFLNLLVGDLTLIGPRPEVPDIVQKYSQEQRKVLQYTPGITGVGALDYTNTQAQSIPPNVPADLYYLEHLLDPKLRMEVEYEENRRFSTDLGVIYCTALLVCKSIVGRTGHSAPQVVTGTGHRRSGP
jgi:lipopolysaccharide/colanic/teichoic acid biosynthesis glycosyltransferase